jgi:hypothetical protein
MRKMGWIVFAVATFIAVYALMFFDTSVDAGSSRVHNIGLMQDRQNLLIFGCIAALAGLLMAMLSRQTQTTVAERFEQAITAQDTSTVGLLIRNGSIDVNGRKLGGLACWLRVAIQANAPGPFRELYRLGADPDLPDGYEISVRQLLKNAQASTDLVFEAILDDPSLRAENMAARGSVHAKAATAHVTPPAVSPAHSQAAPAVMSLSEQLNRLAQLRDRLIFGWITALAGFLMAILSRQTQTTIAERFEQAITAQDTSTVGLLIRYGSIDVNGRKPGGLACWLRVAIQGNAPGPFRELYRLGADPDRPDGYEISVRQLLKTSQTSTNLVFEAILDDPGLRAENMAARGNAPAKAATPQVTPAAVTPARSQAAPAVMPLPEQLTRLAQLRERGMLTDDEFQRAKARLLA